MTIEKIQEALRSVIDPATGVDIVTAQMIVNIDIQGGQINVTINSKKLEGRLKGELTLACQDSLSALYPDTEVNIHMISPETQQFSFGPKPSPEQMSKNPLPHVRNFIAVTSGKGGVGKSTVAVNLALGLKQMGFKVGILDGDIYGPSIPTMLGLKGRKPEVRKIYGLDKLVPLEAHGIYAMSIGFFIEPEQAVVLRGPKLDGIMQQFVKDVVWPPLDFMIIDLPPGTGDVQLSLVQILPVTGAIIVVTPQDVAVDDAIKAVTMMMMPNVSVPILGVVENMSWFTPAELPDNKYFIFGQGGGQKLVEMSGSSMLGQIPIIQSIREGSDTGVPAVTDEHNPSRPYYIELASNVNRETNLRNEVLNPTKIVERS